MPIDLVATARSQSLGDLPRRAAQRTPSKPALVDGDHSLTFAELDAVIDRTGVALAGLGLQQGDRCAVLSRNCWEFAVLSFATARLGIVLVPINFMLGAQEIAFVLGHSGARVVVGQDAFAEVLDAACDLLDDAPQRVVWRSEAAAPGWTRFENLLAGADGEPPVVAVADDDPIRLMYTSGTESRPKGVLISSRSLLWQYVSCVVDGGMSAEDVELHALPFYHCAQLDCFLGPDVFLGATSVITQAPDPATVLELVERHRVTKFFAPPTVWIGLLRHPDFDRRDLSSLRKGYYGASPMPVEILAELSRRLPDVQLWNFYGQTEMAPLATILGPAEQSVYPGSAGRPSLNVETRVVGPDDEPLPAGEVGEIVHRSPHATSGYYADDAKTAEAFRGGWFHSGDLGRFDENGVLYVVDRVKDMIKTGGENVASREVEEAIYQLEGVQEVAVLALPDPRWVEAVTAVVVPKPGVDLTEEAVIAHARGVLAGFKVPKRVVVASALPKNPSGKILKRQLREELTAAG